MVRFVVLTVFLTACGGDEAEVCREGYTLDADGHCYPPETATLEDALRNLPECEPVVADGGIEFQRGCGNGACANMTASEIDAVLGDTPDCYTASWSRVWTYCYWPSGVEGLFPDEDEDVLPDEAATTERIHLYPPFAHGTVDGSGIGANMRCFIDELGLPDELDIETVGTDLRVRMMYYDELGVQLFDQGSDDGSGAPNGYVDDIYMWGVTP